MSERLDLGTTPSGSPGGERQIELEIRGSHAHPGTLSLALPGRNDAHGLREALVAAGFRVGDRVTLTRAGSLPPVVVIPEPLGAYTGKPCQFCTRVRVVRSTMICEKCERLNESPAPVAGERERLSEMAKRLYAAANAAERDGTDVTITAQGVRNIADYLGALLPGSEPRTSVWRWLENLIQEGALDTQTIAVPPQNDRERGYREGWDEATSSLIQVLRERAASLSPSEPRPHVDGKWCSDTACQKCYSAETHLRAIGAAGVQGSAPKKEEA